MTEHKPLPRPALIEVVELMPAEEIARNEGTVGEAVVPNEVRVNGTPLLAPEGYPIRVHEIALTSSHLALVTMTLVARRVVIGQEPLGAAEHTPHVVCLCGSTRFRSEFEVWNRSLTMAGAIVLAPGVFGHAEQHEDEVTEEQKAALDRLHLAKIDLADSVLVVNPGGYVGESTRNEIAYATALGIPVEYTYGVGDVRVAGDEQ